MRDGEENWKIGSRDEKQMVQKGSEDGKDTDDIWNRKGCGRRKGDTEGGRRDQEGREAKERKSDPYC